MGTDFMCDRLDEFLEYPLPYYGMKHTLQSRDLAHAVI